MGINDGNGASLTQRVGSTTAGGVNTETKRLDADGFALPTYKTKVFVLSARDETSCKKMVADLKSYLEKKDTRDPSEADLLLQSLSYTLDQRRNLLPWVSASVVPFTRGSLEMIEALGTLQFAPTWSPRQPKIAMIFTGEGAQWHAMGRELIPSYPPFKASLKEADGILKGLGADWSLMEELNLSAGCSRVDEVGLSLPLCVALQISLVRLLLLWGVKPAIVLGHSTGEIAAAWTVGAISYQDAMTIAYRRAEFLAAEPVPCARTVAAVANRYRDALQSALGKEKPENTSESVLFVSSVTAARVPVTNAVATPDYWVTNLTQPTKFAVALEGIVQGCLGPNGARFHIAIEVGPQTVLRDTFREVLAQSKFQELQLLYLGCLTRNINARDHMQALAANLVRSGYPVNTESVNFPFGKWPHLHVLNDLSPNLWDY